MAKTRISKWQNNLDYHEMLTVLELLELDESTWSELTP
jgi:hypothetical protein